MRGVFFLANDTMFDQAVAFLASFRRYNQSIPLMLIPFDDSAEMLKSIRTEYDFSVWNDAKTLLRCDRLSASIKGKVFGHYRKFAAWEGPFDEFIYVDVDTVILEPVNSVFEFLREYDFLASHSNIASLRKWVWKDSMVPDVHLTHNQIAYSANSGFICSKMGALTLDGAFAASTRRPEILEHLATELIDQPFLNFYVVTSGISYSSLYFIFLKNRKSDIPLERWGGNDLGPSVDGRLLHPWFPRTLLVHWAGEWRKAKVEGRKLQNYELWNFYRSLKA
jgi:hypothetical protein